MTRIFTDTVVSTRKVVASAGTAERLVATSTPVLWVTIQAETDNTGRVALGDAGVIPTAGTTAEGVILVAGSSISFTDVDLWDIWIDAGTTGDGVTLIYGKSA